MDPARRQARSRGRSSTSPAASRRAASAACCRSRSRRTTRSSGRFYVYYTARDGRLRIVEYRRASANRADPARRAPCCRSATRRATTTAACCCSGPTGCSTPGSATAAAAATPRRRGNAQNLGTLLGKILRIDPRRSGGRAVPRAALQPVRRPRRARPEIYAYGLRNPWRFSFTPAGDLVVGDVGQDEVEEIDDRAPARAPTSAGACSRAAAATRRASRRPGHVPPVIQRFHSAGNCSITGGVVVRDPVLSALRGRYVFGDFCRGVIESARLSGTSAADVRAHARCASTRSPRSASTAAGASTRPR